MAEEIVLGIIIAVLAYASAVGRPSAVVSWLVAIAGLWTLVAPTVIAYSGMTVSQTSDIVAGIVVWCWDLRTPCSARRRSERTRDERVHDGRER